ncbi:pilus assembly protein PilM [Oceanisphaera sp.]|uniref:pilus assembly protein PilM n=1 Tax=Oceanisphaera sp. TaxID=1929979 RepID=UPI003A8F3FCE
MAMAMFKSMAFNMPVASWLRRPRTHAIGLELSLNRLNLAQFKSQPPGGLPILQAACSLPYPSDRDTLLASPQSLKALLASAFKQYPFRGRRVTTLLPADKVRTLSLSYPLKPGQDETDIILTTLAQRLNERLEDLIIDYIPIRTTDDRPERLVLIAMARRSEVIDYLELLRRAGLDVASVEIGQTAISRLILWLNGHVPDRNSLVINFGNDNSYLTMIAGRRLVIDHSIDFGEATLLKRLASELDISGLQARALMRSADTDGQSEQWTSAQPCNDNARTLALDILLPDLIQLKDEIRRTLIYAASELHGQPVHNLYLFGSLARWNGLREHLQGLIEIPAQYPDPLGAFQGERWHTSDGQQDFCIATGLALKELTPHA